MKRIGYDNYGGPEVMYIQEFTPSSPEPRDVVVTVKAASINPIDWKLRQGAMRHITGENFPRGMGSEFSGIVAQVGADVTDFKIGDEVVGSTTFERGGSISEAATTSDGMLAKKPAGVSFIDAAAVSLVGITAWLALTKIADLKPGQRLLINGALGGVGQAAAMLAASIGALTTGRVSPQDFDEAKALGLASVLDYTQPLPEDLKGTFDVIYDVNGSLTKDDVTTELTKSYLGPEGLLVDNTPTPAKINASAASDRHKLVFCEGSRENLESVLALVAAGKLHAAIGQVRPLDEAIPMISTLENGVRVSGKSVITFG